MIRIACFFWSVCACCGVLASQEREYQIIEDRASPGPLTTIKLRLHNGVSVLLYSDPSLQESYGALCVEAGAWHDPAEFPGMAHFVEHLLFLGNEKYPVESEYMEYLQARGGMCNAFTEKDRTIYGFSIQDGCHRKDFAEALDRFSHFFIDPLFSSSALQREMHAVHHEFEDNSSDELYALWRVFKDVSNIDHPSARFSCGNLDTLSRLHRQDVVRWFGEHYISHNMHLVLASPLPMPELIQFVVQSFGRIPIRQASLELSPSSQQLLPEKVQGHLVHIASLVNSKYLSLVWEVPADFLAQGGADAAMVLEKFFNYGLSPGWSQVLEESGLAYDGRAQFWQLAKNQAMFRLDISLTAEGVVQYEKVIEICHDALQQMQTKTLPPHLLARFALRPSCFSYPISCEWVMKVAQVLVDVDLASFPANAPQPLHSLAERVQALARQFTPKNGLFFLMAPSHGAGVTCSQLEKWIGAPYVIRDIPADLVDTWNQPIPVDAPFCFVVDHNIGSSWGMTSAPCSYSLPIWMIDDEYAQIRLLKTQQMPAMLESFFCFTTPPLDQDVRTAMLGTIFSLAVNNALYQRFAREEIIWDLEIDRGQLCICLQTPTENVKNLFHDFFSLIKTFHVTQEEFEAIKQELVRSYAGDPDPIEYAHELLDSLSDCFTYTHMELYRALLQMEYEEYEHFENSLFHCMFTEGAFFNCPEESLANALWQIVYDCFAYQPCTSKRPGEAGLVFDDVAYAMCYPTYHKGNAAILVLEGWTSDPKISVGHDVLMSILESVFFQELRTRQQVAYRLYNWSENIDRHIVHGFALQSTTYASEELLRRMDLFLEDFSARAEEILTPERVQIVSKTILQRLKTEQVPLYDQERRRWLMAQISALTKMKNTDVILLAQKTFSACNRRRIAVLIAGSRHPFSLSEWTSPYQVVDKDFLLQHCREPFALPKKAG